MERLRGTCISIHASAREATSCNQNAGLFMEISIHASAREATYTEKDYKNSIIPISIHASAREATSHICPFYEHRAISIHASAREATLRANGCEEAIRFQSTPPRGRRRTMMSYSLKMGSISIHASAREATQLRRTDMRAEKIFQSTPPRGRRLH